MLKVGSGDGGLVRQVVGIGGQVGKTYFYTALELFWSATACCIHICSQRRLPFILWQLYLRSALQDVLKEISKHSDMGRRATNIVLFLIASK